MFLMTKSSISGQSLVFTTDQYRKYLDRLTAGVPWSAVYGWSLGNALTAVRLTGVPATLLDAGLGDHFGQFSRVISVFGSKDKVFVKVANSITHISTASALQGPHPGHSVPPAFYCPGSPAWESPAGECWGPSLPQHSCGLPGPPCLLHQPPASELPHLPCTHGDFNRVLDPLDYTPGGSICPPWTPYSRPIPTWTHSGPVLDPLDYTPGVSICPPCPSLDRILQAFSYTDSFRSLHPTCRIYSYRVYLPPPS
jgi:hypothetical protein